VDRQPELSMTILNGVFASAFCATLQVCTAFAALSTLTLGSTTTQRSSLSCPASPGSTMSTASSVRLLPFRETQKLATIHPFPPAQLPNFAKGLDGQLLPGASKRIAEEDTLAFMDAGAYCNIRSLAPTLRLLN
jgi:phospholipase A2